MGTSTSNTLDVTVSDPSGFEYDITFDTDCFASGKHRNCHIGRLHNPGAPKHNRKVVLKVWKSTTANKFNADYECVKDLERSILCHELCLAFNQNNDALEATNMYALPISFPAPLRVNIKRGAQQPSNVSLANAFNNIPIQLKEHKYLTVQLHLKDSAQYTYDKLTSNNGWTTCDSEYEFLSAFSHFSWCHSKGKMLITSFQGLQRGHSMLLSDAVIHSDTIRQHGHNDLGIVGMVNFFINHECNACCAHLPTPDTSLLIEYLSTESILNVEAATTYVFELNEKQLRLDEANIRQAYTRNVSVAFAAVERQVERGQIIEQCAQVEQTEVCHDKMEQIEHVVGDMTRLCDDNVVELEEHVVAADCAVVDSDDSHDTESAHQEEEELAALLVDHVSATSWFGDDDVYDEEVVALVSMEGEADAGEWELL